ncbi:MAG: pantoate--beta-alanine ligase, partial [Planctomycetota bacterium]
MTEVVRRGEAIRAAVDAARRAGRTVGLVPTMGALHEGHLSLVRAARGECDLVVASVFVNPTQFAEGEDYDRYPRDLEADQATLAAAGCDLLFAPSVEAMYPAGSETFVDVGVAATVFEGAARPTH